MVKMIISNKPTNMQQFVQKWFALIVQPYFSDDDEQELLLDIQNSFGENIKNIVKLEFEKVKNTNQNRKI